MNARVISIWVVTVLDDIFENIYPGKAIESFNYYSVVVRGGTNLIDFPFLASNETDTLSHDRQAS